MFLLASVLLSISVQAGGPPPHPRPTPRIVVTLSEDSPSADIVLEGETQQHAVFEACALGTLGDVGIDDLELRNCVTTEEDADGDCADMDETAGSDDPVYSIVLDYWDTDGTIQSADGSLVAGSVEFTDLNMWVPPCRDGTMLLPVTLTFYEAGASAAVPGDEVQLNWYAGLGSSFHATDITTDRPIVRATRFVASALMVFHENVPSFYAQDDTPSGEVVPGMQETFRHGVEVLGDDDAGFYSQSEMLYQVLTLDTTGSGWNTCEQLGAVTWELYDWEGPDFDWEDGWADSYPYLLDATWEFYTRTGTPCTDAPSEELWYAVAVMDYGLVTWAENLFSVYMDSSGASAGDELMLRTVNQSGVESMGLNSLIWMDGAYPTEFNGTYVDTEVDGGILQFVE